MLLIRDGIGPVKSLLGRQSIKDCSYRLSIYCLEVIYDNSRLLYNNMTGELLQLEAGEALEQNREELIRRRFLVPDSFDEYIFAKQLKHVLLLMEPKIKAVTSFLIFPTTDCNARCFYCYELGRKRVNMSDKTAHDTASFIKQKSLGKDVQLRWFGGEPLFNLHAIDIITDDLRANGVSFRSQMTSNGYLFDERTVKRAVENWKLDSIQISLDGTEKVYNKSKAFIYRDTNAFKRVLHNIGLLLNAGVEVNIRLNMDKHNYEDLIDLCKELSEKFYGNEKLNVYAALLRDFGYSIHDFNDADEQIRCYKDLSKTIKSLNLSKGKTLDDKVSVRQCMADKDNCITILPDGRLGRCEHESEDHFVGSILSDDIDRVEADAWKETISIPECKDCIQYPTCIKLVKCPWHTGGCTEEDRKFMLAYLTDRIINTYDQYKLSADNNRY